jgi:hypothetical protein
VKIGRFKARRIASWGPKPALREAAASTVVNGGKPPQGVEAVVHVRIMAGGRQAKMRIQQHPEYVYTEEQS